MMELGWAHLLILVVTIVTVIAAVFLHYEAFIRLSKALENSGRRGRQGILMMIMSLIIVHVIEIWMFGIVAWMLTGVEGAGGITASYDMLLLDYVYFSAVTFTTLGYGDMFPQGAIRFLYGSEALVGFALITWSASLTFLEMQRHWMNKK